MGRKTRIKQSFPIKSVVLGIFIAIAVLGAWALFEHITLKKPLKSIYSENPEFKGIIANVKYHSIFTTGSIDFNLQKVSEPTKITPFILLVKYIKKQNDDNRQFSRVYLQYKGKTKFIIDGLDYTAVTVETQISPPEEVALKFPPYLKNLNGQLIFAIPHGDPQWVQQKEIKNFQKFLFEWYINDWMVETRKKAGKNAPPIITPDIEPSISDEDIDIEPARPIKAPQEKSDSSAQPEATQTNEAPPVEPEEVE